MTGASGENMLGEIGTELQSRTLDVCCPRVLWWPVRGVKSRIMQASGDSGRHLLEQQRRQAEGKVCHEKTPQALARGACSRWLTEAA